MKQSDEVRLTKVIVRAFQQHWKKILRNLERGKPSLGKKRYRCFEAETEERAKQLAKKFYGISHARKMVALSHEKIVRNLSCFLPAAFQYALREFEDEPEEQEGFIESLVGSEYVLLDSKICDFIMPDENDWSEWNVKYYPDESLYSDWFEYSFGGFFDCGSFIITKSTGEIFSDKELVSLKKSIISNIKGSAPELLWGYQMEALDMQRVWIYLFEIDKYDYLEAVEDLISDLSQTELRQLCKRIIENAIKERIEYGSKILIPEMGNRCERFEKMVKKYLKKCEFEKRQQIILMLKKLIYKKNFGDIDLREVEKYALEIKGKNDFMTYHPIQYYGDHNL